MDAQIYILIAIVALAAVFAILALKRKTSRKPLSRLAAAAFSLALAGIIFSENRIVGYTLMTLGIGLAIADIFRKKNP